VLEPADPSIPLHRRLRMLRPPPIPALLLVSVLSGCHPDAGPGSARGNPAQPEARSGATPDEHQILWQRDLDQALALAHAEGRALFIAVNMDGESASDRIVQEEYRDARFVADTRPFVCLVASVFRHNPRDYDEHGRRIPARGSERAAVQRSSPCSTSASSRTASASRAPRGDRRRQEDGRSRASICTTSTARSGPRAPRRRGGGSWLQSECRSSTGASTGARSRRGTTRAGGRRSRSASLARPTRRACRSRSRRSPSTETRARPRRCAASRPGSPRSRRRRASASSRRCARSIWRARWPSSCVTGCASSTRFRAPRIRSSPSSCRCWRRWTARSRACARCCSRAGR
jgi:hypothetical protein